MLYVTLKNVKLNRFMAIEDFYRLMRRVIIRHNGLTPVAVGVTVAVAVAANNGKKEVSLSDEDR